MTDKKTPSQESHRDRSSQDDKPFREGVEYSEHQPDSGDRSGPVTINEREPLPSKPPTRKDA